MKPLLLNKKIFHTQVLVFILHFSKLVQLVFEILTVLFAQLELVSKLEVLFLEFRLSILKLVHEHLVQVFLLEVALIAAASVLDQTLQKLGLVLAVVLEVLGKFLNFVYL